MYFVFISRLIVAFDTSIYMYPKYIFIILYSILGIYWGIAVGMNFTLVHGNADKDGTSFIICISYYPVFGALVQLFADLFFSTVCLALFLRPLLHMMGHGQPDDS